MGADTAMEPGPPGSPAAATAGAAGPVGIQGAAPETAAASYVDGAGPDIDQASEHLAQAVNELTAALRVDPALSEASSSERQLFAKSLTLTKIKLENAIAVVRASGGPRMPGRGVEPQDQ
jgi:hypothetical protein